jgi:uncharacterized protein (DUF305 family)
VAPLSGPALDKAFVDGMVPHHQVAVDMAKAELAKGQDPRVKALAQSIADSQTKEIGQMRMITQRVGAGPTRKWSGPMGTIMGVPISMVMARMGAMVASAPDTDRVFLLMMIPHHASAIVMANYAAPGFCGVSADAHGQRCGVQGAAGLELDEQSPVAGCGELGVEG